MLLAEEQEHHRTVLLSVQHSVLVISDANRKKTVAIHPLKVCTHVGCIVLAYAAGMLGPASVISKGYF